MTAISEQFVRFIKQNAMKQGPSWEANSHWASQEIPRILWSPKVHYRVHETAPLDLILNHMNSVHVHLHTLI